MGIKQAIENAKYDIIQGLKKGSGGQIYREVTGKEKGGSVKPSAGSVEGFESSNISGSISGGITRASGGSPSSTPSPSTGPIAPPPEPPSSEF